MVNFFTKLIGLFVLFFKHLNLLSVFLVVILGIGIYYQLNYFFKAETVETISENAKIEKTKIETASNINSQQDVDPTQTITQSTIPSADASLPGQSSYGSLVKVPSNQAANQASNQAANQTANQTANQAAKPQLAFMQALVMAKPIKPSTANILPPDNSSQQDFSKSSSLAPKNNSVNDKLTSVVMKDLKIKSGDTLGEILIELGVTGNQIEPLLKGFTKYFNPKKIYPGQKLSASYKQELVLIDASLVNSELEYQRSKKPDLDLINIDLYLDETKYLRASLQGNEINIKELTLPTYIEHVAAKIVIDNSLYLAAKEASIPEDIIYQLTETFSFNVDFQREIYPNDTFLLLYEAEKLVDNDKTIGKNKLVFASLKHALSKKPINYYLYQSVTDDKVIEDFYDENGKSAKRQLVKTPVDAKRISSRFGLRKHPILGFTRMHSGVDFPVNINTPVKAAGDGVITFMARNGGYGKHVVIRHNSTYTTSYSHLNKFAKGLKKGSRVKQGQIVAYSGNTGVSTGPHLHYEVKKYSKAVNPLTLNLPNSKTLKGEELAEFTELIANYETIYASKINSVNYASKVE